jgi:hypothetical protein
MNYYPERDTADLRRSRHGSARLHRSAPGAGGYHVAYRKLHKVCVWPHAKWRRALELGCGPGFWQSNTWVSGGFRWVWLAREIRTHDLALSGFVSPRGPGKHRSAVRSERSYYSQRRRSIRYAKAARRQGTHLVHKQVPHPQILTDRLSPFANNVLPFALNLRGAAHIRK